MILQYYFFFQVSTIIANTDINSPIYSPKWLIIFNLHFDCELIIANFYNQEPELRNWILLIWAYRILARLPDLAEERNWSNTFELPSLCMENDEADGFLQHVSFM